MANARQLRDPLNKSRVCKGHCPLPGLLRAEPLTYRRSAAIDEGLSAPHTPRPGDHPLAPKLGQRFLSALLLSLTLVCAPIGHAQDRSAVDAGRTLADRLCASCHAIGKTGPSKLAKAPPFRVIANRYSVWTLQEALAEGIVTGHAQMPEFVLNPDEINDLLSFMDTFTAKSKTK